MVCTIISIVAIVTAAAEGAGAADELLVVSCSKQSFLLLVLLLLLLVAAAAAATGTGELLSWSFESLLSMHPSCLPHSISDADVYTAAIWVLKPRIL